jgi:hypothetical protein
MWGLIYFPVYYIMSYNKWKSTNIYGIFNNKNLTDASGNLIETCNAVFDGNVTGNVINSTTDINGVTLNVTNGNFTGDVTCEDINCYDIEATNIINCNELTTNIFLCNGDIGTDYLNLYSSQTTVTSSFSGNIVCSQPFKGPAYKKVIIYCDAIIGSASYTYQTAFVNSPVITSGNNSLVSALSATSVTVTTTTSTSTFIIIEGF